MQWRATLSWILLALGNCLAQQPAFEAASVKLVDPAARPFYGITGGPGTRDPGRIRFGHVAMIQLLMRAYDVESDQISGPASLSWIRDFSGPNAYDITATIPPGATKEQFQAMLRNLLTERFHLAVHHETRNFPGYDLVVAKGGPKLSEAPPDAAKASASAPPPPLRRVGKDGFVELPPGPGTGSIISSGTERVRFQERSLAEFAAGLGSMVSQAIGADRNAAKPRVFDKTGLTGKYNFALEFSCAGCEGITAAMRATMPLLAGRNPADGPPADTPTETGSGLPGIFVALEKQLGLRLEKRQDVPTDVIVIDSLEKIPAAN